ncbi:hypothetical protein JTB14_008410 [Gonioctena quinquepunctata]|nr:hypothetical protein JTB14_008410 [Gonioctena quinquepunctata]
MGVTCAARLCKNISYNCKKSFFRFLTDVAKARTWVVSCGREDLLEKLDELHVSHRLCQDHFEDKMFTNPHHDRLNFNAVPTLFPALEGSSRGPHLLDHSYTPLYELPCLDQRYQLFLKLLFYKT